MDAFGSVQSQERRGHGSNENALTEKVGDLALNGTMSRNGTDHSDAITKKPRIPWRKCLPVLLLQVSVFQTMAGPIGFLALRHISFPMVVLGKVRHVTKVFSLRLIHTPRTKESLFRRTGVADCLSRASSSPS